MEEAVGLTRKSIAVMDKAADAAVRSADVARKGSESAVAAFAETAKVNAAMLDALRTMAAAQETANKLKITQSQIDSIYRSSDHP
jgi:hypothetical protein